MDRTRQRTWIRKGLLCLGLLLASWNPLEAQGPDAAELLIARDAQLAQDREQLRNIAPDLPTPWAQWLSSDLDPTSETEGELFFPLPEVDPGAPSPSEAHDDSARAWVELARQAIAEKHFTLANPFLRRALLRAPNHAEARRLLGYVRHDEKWATPQAVRRLQSGQILHDRFGWVPSAWVDRLDAGELPAPAGVNGSKLTWIPADEADRLRQQDFRRAWRIETPHYQIQANVPLEEGIAFGRKLEDFHQLFEARLADVIGADRLVMANMARRPDAQPTAPASNPHRVRYYATKQEYLDFLRPREGPTIDLSLGIYIPREIARSRGEDEASYFYDDRGGQIETTATLYHEVSHQLLFELSGPSRYERNIGHYWVFEGLGTYFETVRPQPDGSLRVGGRYGPRMNAARVRLVDQGENLPTAALVRFDRNRFNDEEQIYLNYAKAMALTVFLMDAENGRYRLPFLQYVSDAYRGRLRDDAGRSLNDRIGLSYEELDQRLLDYLAQAPD